MAYLEKGQLLSSRRPGFLVDVDPFRLSIQSFQETMLRVCVFKAG